MRFNREPKPRTLFVALSRLERERSYSPIRVIKKTANLTPNGELEVIHTTATTVIADTTFPQNSQRCLDTKATVRWLSSLNLQ